MNEHLDDVSVPRAGQELWLGRDSSRDLDDDQPDIGRRRENRLDVGDPQRRRPARGFFGDRGRLVVGAYLFGGVTIAQFFDQGAGMAVPAEVMSALPYLATIIVLVLISSDIAAVRRNVPVSLGKAYRPES